MKTLVENHGRKFNENILTHTLEPPEVKRFVVFRPERVKLFFNPYTSLKRQQHNTSSSSCECAIIKHKSRAESVFQRRLYIAATTTTLIKEKWGFCGKLSAAVSFSHFRLTGKCVWQKVFRRESAAGWWRWLLGESLCRHASSFHSGVRWCWCENSCTSQRKIRKGKSARI